MSGRFSLRGWISRAIRVFGFACLMVASAIGGHVGWILWGTGLETARAQEELRSELRSMLEEPSAPPRTSERVLPGDAYAALVIPSIDLDVVVVEGPAGASYISAAWTNALKKGPVHYPGTADPWDSAGRVGIAGHRTTYLHPFLNLDRVQPGDEIRLLTPSGVYVYRTAKSFILPAAGSGVVLRQTGRRTLVLTTCNPRYSSRERLIVTASLTDAPP